LSHDFNRDPEVIEARKLFGDWIGFAWQEILAIGDRNKGVVPGTVEQIAAILAPISLQKYHKRAADTSQNFLRFAAKLGWIRIETNCIVIANHGEYHRKRGTEQAPSETPLPKLPKLLKRREDNTSHFSNEALRWPSPDLLIKLYNEKACDDYPAVSKVTDGRIKKAQSYLKQFPDQQFWEEIFVELNRSSFLRGKAPSNGHESFQANFDWLLTKGKDGTENVIKVWEGKYRDA